MDDDTLKEIYLGKNGTVSILNPQDPDRGTASNPNSQNNNLSVSKDYFDRQPGTLIKE